MKTLVIRSAILVALIFSSHAYAEDYRSRPEVLRGTKEKQREHYRLAVAHGIGYMPLDADIQRESAAGRLVRLNDASPWYYLDDDLGEGYHNRPLLYHVRPWVQPWVNEFARRFQKEFGIKSKVSSLVRTQARQEQIQRVTTAAAREIPSAHLTGAAIDISTKGFTEAQVRWLRRDAVALIRSGRGVAFEEQSDNNMHFLIFPPPEPAPPPVRLPVFPLAALVQCMR